MNYSRTSQERQLKRWSLWANRWLAELLACMPIIAKAPLPKSARVWLERRLSDLAGLVTHIVMIRAAQLYRPAANVRDRFSVNRARARGDVRALPPLSLRAAIGGRLRGIVKTRGSFQQRAETILRALRQQDKLLARQVRRMRKGLSRRMNLHTRATETLECFGEFTCAVLAGVARARAALADGPWTADTS